MAARSPHTMPLGGYDYEFVKTVEERLLCLCCLFPLKDAVLTKCGHKFCQGYLNEWLRSDNRCPSDRQPLDPDRDVFPDKSTQREVMDLHVKCNSPLCEWVGELREAETHLEKCTNTNCTKKLPRPEMTKHVENECEWRVVLCCYCRTGIFKRDEVIHHKKCYNFPLKCVNGCGEGMIPRSKRKHLDQHIKSSVGHHLSLARDRIMTLEKSQTEEIKKREKIEDELKHTKSSMGHHLSLARDKITTLEKSQTEEIKKRDKIEAQLKQIMEGIEEPTFTWPIRGFSHLNSEINSPSFYSWNHGYKLKMQVYPNGYGDGKGTHLSVYVVLVKGENDAILAWPFKRGVEISLLSQKQDEKDHYVETVYFSKARISDVNGKPKTKENVGRGFDQFVSRQELSNSPYLVDDTLVLQARVRE